MDATTIERPAVAEEVIDRAEVRDGKPLVRYGATEAARLKDAEMEREAAEHRAMEAERLAALTADAPKPQDDDTMDGPVTTGALAGLLQDDCAGLIKAALVKHVEGLL